MATITENKKTSTIPDEPIADDAGKLSIAWRSLFSKIIDLLNYIRPELIIGLNNNQATFLDVPEVTFDSTKNTAYLIEFYAQRVYTGSSVFEFGLFTAEYLFPSSGDVGIWVGRQRAYYPQIESITVSGPFPEVIPVHPLLPTTNLRLTGAGVLQYQTSNLAGTKRVDRLVLRIRPIAGKSSQYSELS